MRPVFNDPVFEKQFDSDGYVPIKLYDKEELKDIISMLKNLQEDDTRGGDNIDSSYKLSFFNDSPEFRKKVFDTIAAYFQPKVDKYLKSYKPLIINVFDKEPGAGEVSVHQNWTFVDESKYTSVSVWIPLIDVSRYNGTLEFVKGSHRVLSPYRSPSIPWCFEDLRTELKTKYLQPLEITVGQAGVLDDSILHWSSENNSDQVRTAIQLIMIPDDSTPIHYYRDDSTPEKLEVFEVDSEFFTKFQMHEKPQNATSIGFIDYAPIHYNENELLDKIAINNPAIRELKEA